VPDGLAIADVLIHHDNKYMVLDAYTQNRYCEVKELEVMVGSAAAKDSVAEGLQTSAGGAVWKMT
jgi:hypothetical protein